MALALPRDRFAVHVACFRSEGVRGTELIEAGVPILVLPIRSFRSLRQIVAAVVLVRRYVRCHRIGVVHAFDAPANLFLVLAALFLRRPVILTSQRAHRTLAPPALRIGLRLGDRLADGVVVNCDAIRRHLVSDFKVPAQRVHVCYNGLVASRFSADASRGVNGAVPLGATVVGTVCVHRTEKDLPTLLRAFARCAHADPQLFLVVVGDGPERPGLERLVEELGIAPRCRFQGRVADVAPWLACMDLFVLPSISEALSNALMEAMASRCACIASRVGGNVELVRPGDTGLLFEPGDVLGLADQITRLAGDRALRIELGSRASDFIRRSFSAESAAGRLGSLYESLAAARRHL
jgi:glycosyltransferase involved in cell wall biosynthesis